MKINNPKITDSSDEEITNEEQLNALLAENTIDPKKISCV